MPERRPTRRFLADIERVIDSCIGSGSVIAPNRPIKSEGEGAPTPSLAVFFWSRMRDDSAVLMPGEADKSNFRTNTDQGLCKATEKGLIYAPFRILAT
jgi:hypothetical protein